MEEKCWDFARKFTFVFLALLLLAQLAQASWYTPQYDKVGVTWSNWVPASMAAVMAAFLVAVLAWMIGYGFGLRELQMWAKNEFYQALASAVIVAGLMTLLFIVFENGFNTVLPGNQDPYKVAFDYLIGTEMKGGVPVIAWGFPSADSPDDDIWDYLSFDSGGYLYKVRSKGQPVEDVLLSGYMLLYNMNFGIEGISSLSIYFNAGALEIPVGAYLKPIFIEPIHLVGHLQMQMLIIVYTLASLLLFFQDTMLSVFLPLGVFLRIFPFTRSAGGLLIAMAIGFYVVFPLTFAFVAIMGEASDDTAFSLQTAGVDLADFDCCAQDFDALLGDAQESISPEVTAKVNQFGSILPSMMIKVYFYPLVVFAITLTFIKMLSPILGADISELGQGLIKMI